MFPFCKICSVFILSHSFEVDLTDRNQLHSLRMFIFEDFERSSQNNCTNVEDCPGLYLGEKDVYFITNFKCLLVEFMTSIGSLNAQTCWFFRISFMWVGVLYMR